MRISRTYWPFIVFVFMTFLMAVNLDVARSKILSNAQFAFDPNDPIETEDLELMATCAGFMDMLSSIMRDARKFQVADRYFSQARRMRELVKDLGLPQDKFLRSINVGVQAAMQAHNEAVRTQNPSKIANTSLYCDNAEQVLQIKRIEQGK